MQGFFIEPVNSTNTDYKIALQNAIKEISQEYSGLSLSETSEGWEVNIPDKHRIGHEAHFAQVTEQYLQYLTDGKIPDWERKNILTKYFLTTQAYKKSR